MGQIAITGSAGLIGRELVKQLANQQHGLLEIDIANSPEQDIANPTTVRQFVNNCDGIIHLAAVSRVAEAQQFPERTWASNILGTQNILNSVLEIDPVKRPWMIHASSREVYGNQSQDRISEDTQMSPVNVYGRSKATCESLVNSAKDAGANVAILRFANVYGDIHDHSDRVIPAFTRAAVEGTTLRVDDASTCMDFTHVSDVCEGICKTMELLLNGEADLPPIHFATGTGTTLGELAQLAVSASGNTCKLNEVGEREGSVHCFIGDPERAKSILGWIHRTPLKNGFNDMVQQFRQQTSLDNPNVIEKTSESTPEYT